MVTQKSLLVSRYRMRDAELSESGTQFRASGIDAHARSEDFRPVWTVAVRSRRTNPASLFGCAEDSQRALVGMRSGAV